MPLGPPGLCAGANLPVPTRLARSDRPGTSATFKKGPDPVVVTGEPAELVMWAFGRDEVRGLSFDGPEDAVAALQSADRGV